MRVHAYAAPAAGRPLAPGPWPLAPTTIERREVGPNDVLIAIQYAGIRHSDIHIVNGDWGPQPFPVVPGHKIVGTVAEVGADVSQSGSDARIALDWRSKSRAGGGPFRRASRCSGWGRRGRRPGR
ncbi:alcohol dehydrogenase catalytic domain-containing protein [Streptomyces incanus]|uniref:Alcohol dehydrogenase catalytic domain-containing protein n=1 Tax=Streptomyces incanus TaxID=887453 RepID=A0ABW0XZK5_9ACTN